MYKAELLIIAFIFILAGALMIVFDTDVSARGLALSEVFIVIGIVFIIIWAILYALVHVLNR